MLSSMEKEQQPVDPNRTQMTYKIHSASLPELLELSSLMDGIVILPWDNHTHQLYTLQCHESLFEGNLSLYIHYFLNL